MFEALVKLTRSRFCFYNVVRLGVMVYLAALLGAGPALRGVHIESSEHGHRYCPEHEQIEIVEREEGVDSDAYAKDGDFGNTPIPALQGDEHVVPHSHVACAFLNGLFFRAPATPNVPDAVTAYKGTSKVAIAPSARVAAFDSILFVAPKTSPPFVAA